MKNVPRKPRHPIAGHPGAHPKPISDATYVDIIRTELTNALTVQEIKSYRIPTGTNTPLESALFTVADVVVRSERTAFHYSNWHTWEASRNITSDDKARQSAQSGTWAKISPYANCLGMASAIHDELRRRLLRDTQLAPYANRVQLVTDNWAQTATSDIQYHCICIVRLQSKCIVMDPLIHRGALVVEINTIAELGGAQRFAYVSGPGDARFFVEFFFGTDNDPHSTLPHPTSSALDCPGGQFEYSDPYTTIQGGFIDGVVGMGHPSTQNVYDTKFGALPSRRNVIFASIFKRRRTMANANCVNLEPYRFLVWAFRLTLDFMQCEMELSELPSKDWLVLAKNRRFVERLRECGLLDGVGDLATFDEVAFIVAFGNIPDIIRNGQDEVTLTQLQLLDDICHELGMAAGEVKRLSQVLIATCRAAYQAMSPVANGGSARVLRSSRKLSASRGSGSSKGRRGGPPGTSTRVHKGGRGGLPRKA